MNSNNKYKNAITGSYLSGKKNVYRLTSPVNSTKSVLVNKNSLLAWVLSENIKNINNLNKLIGKSFVPEQLRGNYGRSQVRNPIYGVPLNFKNVSKVTLSNANLKAIGKLVRKNEIEAERNRQGVAKRARTTAQSMARGRRAQQRSTRKNNARTFYKISYRENLGNGEAAYGNLWVNTNGRVINEPRVNHVLENNHVRNNNLRNTIEGNHGVSVTRIARYKSHR